MNETIECRVIIGRSDGTGPIDFHGYYVNFPVRPGGVDSHELAKLGVLTAMLMEEAEGNVRPDSPLSYWVVGVRPGPAGTELELSNQYDTDVFLPWNREGAAYASPELVEGHTWEAYEALVGQYVDPEVRADWKSANPDE